MFTWASIVSGLVSLANKIMSAFQSKQDRDAGAAVQRDVTNDATTKTLEDVAAPISSAERDKLWEQNKTKYDG